MSVAMFEILFGLKTVAVFDAWTFEHILSGLSVGSAVLLYNNKHISDLLSAVKHELIHPHKLSRFKYRYDLILILALGYLWETLEHYLEVGLAGAGVEYWFQGVEFWPNRLLSDPLMLVLGYMIAKKYPVLVNPARILSVAWLVVHIFVFPHSMYLHEIF